MKVFKCDTCKEYTDSADTLGGSMSKKTIGRMLDNYPNAYHLCSSCADELIKIINVWLADKLLEIKTVSN